MNSPFRISLYRAVIGSSVSYIKINRPHVYMIHDGSDKNTKICSKIGCFCLDVQHLVPLNIEHTPDGHYQFF